MKVKVIDVPFGKIVIAEEEEGDQVGNPVNGLHTLVKKLAGILNIKDEVPKSFTKQDGKEHGSVKKEACNDKCNCNKCDGVHLPKKTTYSIHQIAKALGIINNSAYSYISKWNRHLGGTILTPTKGKGVVAIGSGYSATPKEWESFFSHFKRKNHKNK